MPRFEPFTALRYSPDIDWSLVTSPPYDVLSDSDLDRLADLDPHNIVHIDVPRERDGRDRYRAAADTMSRWVDTGVLVRDDRPTFSVYQMSFTDPTGAARTIIGVLGALEVTDSNDASVLPHERTTPKASTDRLDLTRATGANLSPIWGLSLARGLTDLLVGSADSARTVHVDGVTHTIIPIDDPRRSAEISALLSTDDVLIADGHHRYGVARHYRDEVRASTGGRAGGADLTLAFVSELIPEQLSVEAIHRVYRTIGFDDLVATLSRGYDLEPGGRLDDGTLAQVKGRDRACLVDRSGSVTWLTPRSGAFDGVRPIDGARLEHLVGSTTAEVSYHHDLSQIRELFDGDPDVTAAVLIRPVDISEIERTAREGLLMPPKSTFFTPKLRTGLVLRLLDTPGSG